MKRTILVIALIFIILFSGCSHKKSDPGKSGDATAAYVKPVEKPTYIANLTTSESKVLYTGRSALDGISWSDDEKYVTCSENVIDDGGSIVGHSLHLYKTYTPEEIPLPAEMNDLDYHFKVAFWKDKENVYSVQYNSSPSENGVYFVYNVISKKLRRILETEYDKSAKPVWDKEQSFIDRCYQSDQLTAELKRKTGNEFTWAYISSDKSKFLYSTDAFQVFLYDLKTNKKKFLFYGFNIQWSPGENKILYDVPMKTIYEKLRKYENYDSRVFDSYVYDIKESKSIKIADFAVEGDFSPKDQYLIYHKADYRGLKTA